MHYINACLGKLTCIGFDQWILGKIDLFPVSEAPPTQTLNILLIITKMGQIAVKRTIDIVAAIGGLIILAPIFLISALLISLRLGSPVFFCQIRAGKNGHPFMMYKFRSMTDEHDSQGQLLPDQDRLPGFGKFLRSSSIDELPALWNVLNGDISIVGPRPLLIAYVPQYSDEQSRRLSIKPGRTGWAQINGRNAISWEQKFKLDCWYVDNQSLWLDIKIVWLTLKKVLIREGINAAGDTSMPKFKGSSDAES